ncbi:hypothetical protein FHR99_000462 [Litorivivens lipolytica]|uniref:DUF1214 domain-containing protein n=1 Tax=Litorivivens lipolytica TaxID=1524264 RepID=A0A7W4W2G3_9GAMM|nr:DUF1214 domain-containing protein [Litorivivens lipolytica]MBB3046226.1 hypothetical protein [Litorivivens lipolytica]
MADHPAEYNHTLKAGWDRFCEELKSAGELLFTDAVPDDEITRTTGMRLLSRNIALALQFESENNDPRHPELLHYFDPLRKQGGDNPDALYLGAPVNGVETYRLHGILGSARFIAITVLEEGETPWGGKVIASLFRDDIATDSEGFFELHLSPEPKPEDFQGNWIQTTHRTYRLTIRQFFADWLNEEPMQAVIDCLSVSAPPEPPKSELQSERLQKAIQWLRWSVSYWVEQINKWRAQPNAFFAYNELDNNTIDATPGGLPLIANWRLASDEVAIVRVTPPQAQYWAVEFGNFWWESMDYRYRLCSTNCHHAVLESSGELILVIADQDPGVPNWLDRSAYREGYITFRWVGADSYPRPTLEVVKQNALQRALPKGCKTVNAEMRAQQLRERRLGVIRRFGY